MNVIVILRAVRDPAGFTVNRKAQKIFVNRDIDRLNPADANALEAGLRLADAGHNLTAVSYGGAAAEDVLRQALALGATRAVLVSDAGLPQADAGALARVLQQVTQRLNPDLVLLGAEVLDADLAQVGPRLATALDWPFIEAAHSLSESATNAVQAIVEAGQHYRRLEADLPAVVSVARDSNQPRFPTAARLITVYSAKAGVESLTLAELDLAEGELIALTQVTGQSFPPEREFGVKLEGELDEVARQLVERLRWK